MRWIVLLFLAGVALSSCDGSNSKGIPQTSSVGPGLERAAQFMPMPVSVVQACLDAQARAGIPLLCPSVLPRPTRGLTRDDPPDPVAADFVTPMGRPSGISLQYGVPPPGGTEKEAARPCCFLHFTIETVVPGIEPLTGAHAARLGRREGQLSAQPVHHYSLYQGHLRFRFRAGTHEYLASIHSFKPRARALALLGRLVASLKTAADLAAMPYATSRTRVAVRLKQAGPWGLAYSGGSLWVANVGYRFGVGRPPFAKPRITRVETASGRVSAEVEFPGRPFAIDAGLSGVWAAGYGRGQGVIVHLDRGGETLGSVRTGLRFGAISAVTSGAWATEVPSHQLIFVSADTNSIARRVKLEFEPGTLTAHGSALWVSDVSQGDIVRIEASSGRVAMRIHVCRVPYALKVEGSDMWVSCVGEDTVARVDTKAGRVTARWRLYGSPYSIALVDGAVWVATLDGRLIRIDPVTNNATIRYQTRRDLVGLTTDGKWLWAVTLQDGDLLRLNPDRSSG